MNSPRGNCFQEADEAASQMRAAVRAEQQSTAIVNDFEANLWRALQAEPLALGRGIGGDVRLRDADAMNYWRQIVDKFHGRFLAQRSVRDCGIDRQLEPDEALVLYVTFNSRSGAAFCISAHLYVRRPGSAASPCSEGSPFIDRAHWDDTFISCCVLHVRGMA